MNIADLRNVVGQPLTSMLVEALIVYVQTLQLRLLEDLAREENARVVLLQEIDRLKVDCERLQKVAAAWLDIFGERDPQKAAEWVTDLVTAARAVGKLSGDVNG